MAQVKISELPSASSLTGSEVLPVVQGGSTLGATVNQIKDKIQASTINVLKMNASSVQTLANIGELAFNPDTQTLEVKCSADVTLSIGQENYIRGKNAEASTILNGTVVYVSGGLGANSLIKRAGNADGTAERVIGVATQDIVANNIGFVTTSGIVNKLNTSAYLEGDLLWLGTNGTMTNAKPDTSVDQICIGVVLRAHATEGSILVAVKDDWRDKLAEVRSDLSEIERVVSGGTIDNHITWIDQYSGTISGNTVSAGPIGSGYNRLMMIPVEKGQYNKITATLAHDSAQTNNYKAIAFYDGDISNSNNCLGVVDYIDYASAGTYTYNDIVIPYDTTSIWVFNRKSILPIPTVILTEEIIGVSEKADNNTSDIVFIKDQLIKVDIGYGNIVSKPLIFNGKSNYFFGDSIVYGYIAAAEGVPAHQATNHFPKTFSDSVGATFSNYGVSGASLTKVEGYACVFDKIKSVTLNSDYIFIDAGINDWQLGVDKDTFKSAVVDICNYLTANYIGHVIFITPINHAGRVPINIPQMTVQDVRDIITRVAVSYCYDVVQGSDFAFPISGDELWYENLLFQDKLHPTELGYKIYAKCLQTVLC